MGDYTCLKNAYSPTQVLAGNTLVYIWFVCGQRRNIILQFVCLKLWFVAALDQEQNEN